jgi:hypothetical protein
LEELVAAVSTGELFLFFGMLQKAKDGAINSDQHENKLVFLR